MMPPALATLSRSNRSLAIHAFASNGDYLLTSCLIPGVHFTSSGSIGGGVGGGGGSVAGTGSRSGSGGGSKSGVFGSSMGSGGGVMMGVWCGGTDLGGRGGRTAI